MKPSYLTFEDVPESVIEHAKSDGDQKLTDEERLKRFRQREILYE